MEIKLERNTFQTGWLHLYIYPAIV